VIEMDAPELDGAALATASAAEPPVIEVRHVDRRFGDAQALRDVSLMLRRADIHALLGPNGAGKTTLLRILTGLLRCHAGEVRVLGTSLEEIGLRDYRRAFGFVPSGDRSFYLRMSGVENLLFFGRLAGLRRAAALQRARECLDEVGLDDVGKKMVGVYSHGMQKRLSVARALLMDPPILFVDEATHDLDPEGARRVQDLVAARVKQGTAVIWATQRLDEIRAFADRVTLLHRGEVRFQGTVNRLIAAETARAYVVQLGTGEWTADEVLTRTRSAIGAVAQVAIQEDSEGDHFILLLEPGEAIGRVMWSLEEAGLEVISCREERSGIETAFLRLTRDVEP
jgi:ABC-2 type transport system ATP-binding protein